MTNDLPEKPFASIIILCKNIDHYTQEYTSHYKKLDYPNFEIILLPDDNVELIDGVHITSTGAVTPDTKRNIGVKNAVGEFCVLVDTEVFPEMIGWSSL